jgi:hypothetical protein
MDSSGWLTAKRLRAEALLLALALWSVYAWVIATPGLRDRNGNLKGTDFLHFYTLGSLAAEHRGKALYDMDAQAALAAERVPAAEGIRYLPLYPPQVSMIFVPFARFSYSTALALWWIISTLIYAMCCYSIWRVCAHLTGHYVTVALLAAAFPAFFHLIAWGQTSVLALLCFTIAFLCLRKKEEFLAGIFLGLLVFKPQLGLAGAILFLSLRTWPIIAGAVASATVEITAGVLYYGQEPLVTWLHALRRVLGMGYALEPRPYQTHSLRTFWSMLIPWSSVSLAMYAASAIVVIAWAIQVWRRSRSWELRYSVLLLATVLVSPHLTVYDLVILVPAFLLLADWMIGKGKSEATMKMGALLYLVYILPLVGFVSRWTHAQLSVLAMTSLTYLIWNVTRSESLPDNVPLVNSVSSR